MKTLHKSPWHYVVGYLCPIIVAAIFPRLVYAQSGQIQWVHASADSVLAVVDVYVDGVLAIDDFAYQTATPFMDPSVGSHEVAVALGSSASVADSIASFTIEIADDQDYHAIIAGVLDPNEFRPNPDGRSTRLNLFVLDGALQAPPNPQQFATRQFYCVTDLTAIAFSEGSNVLFQTVRYGEVTAYVEAAPDRYVGRLRATGRASSSLYQTEGAFTANAGKSMLSVVTGFFATPTGLGLTWLNVYSDGTVIHPTDLTEYNRVQIVHASPDPDIDRIDIYFDGNRLLDDFEFMTGTAFINLPSGYHDIDIAPASSESYDDGMKHLRPQLEGGETSHAVLAGVLDTEAFPPNPDGRSTVLDLHFVPEALEASDDPGLAAVRQFYAVPNLPAVTFTTEGNLIGQNLRFGDVTDYAYPEPRDYDGGFRATGLATGLLYRLIGPFTGLADEAVISVFTGFFGTEPKMENFLVTVDGETITGPETTSVMRAQFVHASADPALESIDLYFDGIPLLVNHAFAQATPFMELPAGIHEFAVAASGSASKSEAVKTYRLSYQEAGTYSMVLAGVLDPDQFVPNPEGKDTGLNLFVTDDAREKPLTPNDFNVRQFYGVINMPTSNFWLVDENRTLWQDIGYGDFTGYEASGANTGELHGEVREVGSSRSNAPLIGTAKDWSEEFGNSVLEVITGYLYDAHPGGYAADVRWLHVRADGSVTNQDVTGTWTSTEEDAEIPSSFSLQGNYPNPFNPTTNIAFDLPNAAQVSIEVFDVTGRMVLATTPVNLPAGSGQSIRIEATAWSSGLYLYKVTARSGTSSWIGTGQMMLMK